MNTLRRYWLDALLLLVLLIALQVLDLIRASELNLPVNTGITLQRVAQVIAQDAVSLSVLVLAITAILLAHLLQFFVATLALSQLPERIAQSRPAWWLLQLCAVMLVAGLNRHYFPFSRVYPNIDLLLNNSTSLTLMWVLGVFLLGLACLAVLRSVLRSAAQSLLCRSVWLGVVPLVGLAVWLAPRQPGAASTVAKPNIILIGVDSLRPEVLQLAPYAMPELSGMIQHSIRFRAVTPIARTFAAWMSVLTGQYPATSGVRDNLFPRQRIEFGRLLPDQLRSAGYQTAFAMDEVRFANIDYSFGFDRIASPVSGVSDIAIATFLDFAPVNLLSLFPATRVLLPASYGNRGAHHVYQPQAFNHRLHSLLQQLDERPAFLAVHFCLPHYPYWPDRKQDDLPVLSAQRDLYPQSYIHALRLVDMQIHQFMSDLRVRGLLDNAVVIFMADHGESLNLPSEAIQYLPDTPPRGAAGHGSSVLATEQHEVFIAITEFGTYPRRTGEMKTEVSLVDIHPTVLELAGAPLDARIDGKSLWQSLKTGAEPPARALPVETGIVSPALLAREIREKDVIKELANNYELLDTGMLQLREPVIGPLLRYKERAIYTSEFVLAWIPLAVPASRWRLMSRNARVAVSEVDMGLDPELFEQMKMQFCGVYQADAEHLVEACARGEGQQTVTTQN